jgi:hypothetical protein
MLDYSYESQQNKSSWHSNQHSGLKENKITVGQAINQHYQSRHQKLEWKTHPKVEEEVAELNTTRSRRKRRLGLLSR